MAIPLELGPRGRRLLTAWGETASTYPCKPGYDLTLPTRSDLYRERLDTFVDCPSEEQFEALWQPQHLAAAREWYAPTVLSLWNGSLDDLAAFFDEIRTGDDFDESWNQRASWSSILPELYTRYQPASPILSLQARQGLRKFGIEPTSGYVDLRRQLEQFRDVYIDVSGHVTADSTERISVDEELDQLFALVTTIGDEEIESEIPGPCEGLYTALRGYAAPTGSRGPIEIDIQAATPAIDGYIAGRNAGAYSDLDTEHWAGTHYETWKWDFARYMSNTVAQEFDLQNLTAEDVGPFLDAFWANADEYTDTELLSTAVPQYLLGRWGVVQFADFKERCLSNREEAAGVLSALFDNNEHLVDRLQQFHDFAASEEVSDGNLLRIVTTFLMGVYPDQYVNFQYQRFDTFFSECSNLDSLENGFDARQYYRIVLACQDLRDILRSELPEASMLDVHTLIRLYQDSENV